MSPSFHKSLNVLKLPLNPDIHTYTVGWKVQCTWVSRRRKSISQFKKTIIQQSCQKKVEEKEKKKSTKCESTRLFMRQFWGAPTALSLWLLFAYLPTYLRIVYLYLYIQRELFIWAMRYCACAHSRRLASVSRRVPPSALIYLALGLSRIIPDIRTHAHIHSRLYN